MSIVGREPVLDRIAAPREVATKLGPQLDLLDEIADYGVALLKRCFKTSGRTIEDIVLLPVVFKHLLSTFDAVALLLRAASAYAASIPLRALCEASWTLEWIARKDRPHWARQYYVAYLRRNRAAALKYTPGTASHTRAAEILKNEFPGFSLSEVKQEQIAATLNACERLLASEAFATYNAAFDRFMASRGIKHEPKWFQPIVGNHKPVRSIRGLAEQLGHAAEYDALYGSFSDAVHASAFSPLVSFDGDRVTFEPIRSLDQFRNTCLLAAAFAMRSSQLIVETYRPGELPVFRRTYIEEWRERFMGMPEVVVNAKTIDFDSG